MASTQTLTCKGCDKSIETHQPNAIFYTCTVHQDLGVGKGTPCKTCGLWVESIPGVKEITCGSCAHLSVLERAAIEERYRTVPPEFLKAVRKATKLNNGRSMTQVILGQKLGISSAVISKAETGKDLPEKSHVDWIYEKAAELGIREEDFLESN